MNNYKRWNARSRTFVIVGIAVLALVVSLGAYAIIRVNQKPVPVLEDAPGGLVFDEAAMEGGWEQLSREEIEASLNAKVEEGMINISMNTAPAFPDGRSEGNLMIVNELVNTYPQKVEIVRNDTQEILYASNAIPVGSKIESARLQVELEAGTYPCTAYFHSLDENGKIIGTAGAVINIIVQN